MEDADRTGVEAEGSRFDFLFSPAGTATVRVAGKDSGDGTGRKADTGTGWEVGTGAFRLVVADADIVAGTGSDNGTGRKADKGAGREVGTGACRLAAAGVSTGM